MAYGPVPGPYGAPMSQPPLAPPGRPPRPRPKVRGSILLPIFGVALVLLCFLVVPWVHTAGHYVTLPDVWDQGTPLPWYLSDGWLGILVGATLISFAGTMDSKVFRVLLAILGILGGLTMIGTMLLLAHSTALVPILAGLVESGLWLGYAFLRGLACRIISGLLLLGVTATHTGEVYHLLHGHAFVGAYLASFGYLLCAIGCFVGPRYVMPYQPPMLPPPVIPPPMLPYR